MEQNNKAAELDPTALGKLKALAEALRGDVWSVGETYFDDDGSGEVGMPETVVRGMEGEAGIAVCLDFGANNPHLRELHAAFIAEADPAMASSLIALVSQQAARIAELENALKTDRQGWERAIAVLADSEADRALGATIQRAAGELPEGWEIRISVERGAGTATLYGPDGDEREIPGDGLVGEIEVAIEIATQEGK